MDGSRFDRLARDLARGVSRRALLKSAFGFGGALVGRTTLDAEAARRPAPTPKPVRCPGQQYWNGNVCVCPDGLSACGPDCCPDGLAQCCDNACCFGECYGEELCCPTGQVVCDGVCLAPGQCCTHTECAALDDPDRCITGVCLDNACAESWTCDEAQRCCGGGVCIDTGDDLCCSDNECGDRRCNQETHTCECVPDCTAVECGGNDGCGGICLRGTCSRGTTCLNGTCFQICQNTGDCPYTTCPVCNCLTTRADSLACMSRSVSYGSCRDGQVCPQGSACSIEGECRAPCCAS